MSGKNSKRDKVDGFIREIIGRILKYQIGAAPNLVLREMTVPATNDYYLVHARLTKLCLGVHQTRFGAGTFLHT